MCCSCNSWPKFCARQKNQQKTDTKANKLTLDQIREKVTPAEQAHARRTHKYLWYTHSRRHSRGCPWSCSGLDGDFFFFFLTVLTWIFIHCVYADAVTNTEMLQDCTPALKRAENYFNNTLPFLLRSTTQHIPLCAEINWFEDFFWSLAP